MSYKRGDVVLVPFPFTDLSTTKQRPALIVSSDAFNTARDDVIVVAITSQVPATLAPDEHAVPQSELGPCGLLKPSIVKLGKVVTLHRQLVIKRIGALPPASLAGVLTGIRQLFQT
jgi:mRNA interferase MazF